MNQFERNRELATQQLEALQGLLRHPGWEVLGGRVRAMAETQLAAMRNAKNSDELLRHTYTYMAFKDLLDAPEMLARTLAQQLQSTQK